MLTTVSPPQLYKDLFMIARLMGRRVSKDQQLQLSTQLLQSQHLLSQLQLHHVGSCLSDRLCYVLLNSLIGSAMQQGNEEALVDQVRQQFRMNMHETDETKVRLQPKGTALAACSWCPPTVANQGSCE